MGRLLSGVLYFHNIEDMNTRFISILNHRIFHRLCGEDPMKTVVIVTNRWGSVDEATGSLREQELKTEKQFFKGSVDAGARLMRHYATTDTATEIIQTILSTERERKRPRIQGKVMERGLRFDETRAENELKNDFENLRRKLKRDIDDAVELLQDTTVEKNHLERDLCWSESKSKELERRRTSTRWSVRRILCAATKIVTSYRKPSRKSNNRNLVPKSLEVIQDHRDTVDNAISTDERNTTNDLRSDFNDLLEKLKQDLNQTKQFLESSSVQDRRSIQKDVRKIKKRIRELERRMSSKNGTTCEVAVSYTEFFARSPHSNTQSSLYPTIS
jgi:hypothetical protein